MTRDPANDEDLRRVRAEAEQLLRSIESVTAEFHRRLFDVYPEGRTLFPDGLERHLVALEAALAIIFRNLNAAGALRGPLHLLGADHAARNVGPALLRLSREVLIETLRALAPTPWTSRHEQAWRHALAAIFEPIEAGARAELAALLDAHHRPRDGE